MINLNFRDWVRTILIIILLLTVLSGPVAAAISLNVETTYSGTGADSQAISTRLTLTPQDNPIINATVHIRPTDQGFIDQESFTTTVDPSGSDAEITYEGNGRFFIDELNPDETIQITFDAYPRTIKQESLDVATITVSYIQQGQSLSDREQVTADLSSSSYFAWKEAKSDLEEQQILFYLSIIVIGAATIVLFVKAYEWWQGGTGEDF